MDYYVEIKEQLLNNEINKRIKDYSKNVGDLNTYYSVGKILNEAGNKYGDGIIKEYSIKLMAEIGKGYSTRSLKYMRRFYLVIESGVELHQQLTWSHYIEILKLDDINEINYYIGQSVKLNLGRDELRRRINAQEYQRIDDNTKHKLVTKEETNVIDFVKNPILIKNSNNYNEISEKILKKLILEDIESFMKELGSGFSFIGSEYKIKLGANNNYIDLLLYNIEFNCYVVVELKVTPLMKSHIGQIQVYMNYIDNNLRKINQNRTIGIIICKKDNKFIIEYCSDKRIISREYIVV